MSIGNTRKKTTWSYSRTTCFGNCKYEYYLNYIVKDYELYPPEGNYYADVGKLVHEILAMYFQGELSKDDVYQYFISYYDDYIENKVSPKIMDKTYFNIADYFANFDIDWINNYEILGAEVEERFKVGKYNFVGYIDLLLRDKRDNKLVVLDHKSSSYPFMLNGEVKANSKESFEKYKKQMYLYCHAVHERTGEWPKEMTWNHYKDGGRLATIPFIMSEYKEIMKWFKESLAEIEAEEDFPANLNYFYCNNLCKFRKSCEYKELGGGRNLS
mgnify:FL=1